MTRGSLALVCVVGACSNSRSSTIAAVLDSLAPGARIGARAAPVAQKLKLAWQPSAQPYFEYSDENYRASAGLKGIALIDDDLSAQSPGQDLHSDSARITRVLLGFDSAQAVDPVLERLTRKLGPPERFCYRPAGKDHWPFRIALYFWPDQEPYRLVLIVPLDASPLPPTLTFGVMRPELHPDFKFATRGGCDAA